MCTLGEKGTHKFWQLLHILSGGIEEEGFLALAWRSVGQEEERSRTGRVLMLMLRCQDKDNPPSASPELNTVLIR